MSFRWTKDPKTDANLRSMGLVPEEIIILRSQVDAEEGLRRQARMIAKLNEDWVLQLSLKMSEEDAAFPMIVLQKPATPKSKFWVWSGNHRLAAFDLAYPDATTLTAYVVNVRDGVTMDLLPRIVNVWESGIGFSREEKVMNARWAIENHSMSTVEAARMFGVKPEWIYAVNSAEEAKKLVADVPGASAFSASILKRLHTISSNLNILKGVASILTKYGVRGSEAYTVIDDVRRQSTELQQQGELAKWEKIFQQRMTPPTQEPEREKPGRPKAIRPPAKALFTATTREAFLRNLTGLDKVLERADTKNKLQLTDPADLAVAEKNWRRVKTKMDSIFQEGI